MKYLVNWKDDTIHSAIMTIAGIHRLMARCYAEHLNLQVCVWKLAENDVYATPIPLRVYYDFKFDKLTLFALSGDLVEMMEVRHKAVQKREAA